MKCIVSIDPNNGIGYNGELLFHIEEDMARFKELTIGGTVIMGRKTFESLPNQQPLSDRTNIVLTRDEEYEAPDGVVIAHTPEEAVELSSDDPNTWVIGGEEIYKELFQYCDEVHITAVINQWYTADAFFNFPEIYNSKKWERISVTTASNFVQDSVTGKDLLYTITVYRRIPTETTSDAEVDEVTDTEAEASVEAETVDSNESENTTEE
jgi:dihydrofolate reductase